MENIREELVKISLEWEKRFSILPRITSEISEYDAALLVGCDEKNYSKIKDGMTAVNKGYDIIFNDIRYQIKANRPSGKPGSFVTLVGKANNYDWDILIWILYDKYFKIQEAWQFRVKKYKELFENKKRLSPADMRKGEKIY